MVLHLISADPQVFLARYRDARQDNDLVRDNTCPWLDISKKCAALFAFDSKVELKFFLVTKDNQVVGGFCVLDGELAALWCTERGRGEWLVWNAVQQGAVRLNCFSGYLPELYKRCGFVVEHIERNYECSGPDVFYMSRNPKE